MEAVEALIFAIAKNNQYEILVNAKLQKFIIYYDFVSIECYGVE